MALQTFLSIFGLSLVHHFSLVVVVYMLNVLLYWYTVDVAVWLLFSSLCCLSFQNRFRPTEQATEESNTVGGRGRRENVVEVLI